MGQAVVDVIAQGDEMKSIEILDSTDELFADQKQQIDGWNLKLAK